MYDIYLVDDDIVILEEMVAEIPWRDNGFQVVGWSTSPKTALLETLELRPHILFTDLRMPEMSGLELISALKSSGFSCEFLMVSAYGEFEDTRSFFRLEGFDYILKPIQLDDVQITLERLSKRLLKKAGPASEVLEPATSNPNFNELIAFLTQNYRQKLTLDKLGKQFGLSPNYICNLFAKNYGTTLTRFVTEQRMKEAKRLMENGEIALKEIAALCGYSDYYHFFKVFKEYYGISPTMSREERIHG